MKRAVARQRGMTLIEVLAALAIGAVLLVGLATLVDRSVDDMKGQQAANYQAQVVDAARRYLDAKADVVAAGTPTAATVLAITLKELRDDKFLPASFANTNSYGQGTCVLVRRPAPVDYPRQIDALIVTTGGDKIADKDLPAVAMQAGSGGGYIVTQTPGTARGASWQMQTIAFQGAKCAGSADAALRGNAADTGHLVSSLFYDGAAQQKADFLYRDAISGHPEANTMIAPVRFAGAGEVTPGESCLVGTDAPAGLAIDSATRAVLTCGKDGKWSPPSSWKDPVPDYDRLAALPESAIGDVRMVTSKGRAFTYMGGGVWQALAVDQNGNLKVPEELSTKTLVAAEDVLSKGTMHSDGHITTKQDLHVEQNAFVTGNAEIKGNAEINGNGLVKGDLKVARDITATGVEAEMWMSAPAIALSTDEVDLGGKCNYEEYSAYAKKMVTVYPQGIIVPDRTARLMICGKDNKFIYVQ